MQPTLAPRPQVLDMRSAVSENDYRIEGYIIMLHRTHCTCCSALAEYSEIYIKYLLPSRWGTKTVTNLRRHDGHTQLFNLPIRTIQKPLQTIPFCHECNQPSLASCPPPPLPKPAIRESWREPPLKTAALLAHPAGKKPRAQPTSLEDIFAAI